MAIAGKVAITLSNENDGKWSASVTYDRLTAVTHNNNLYISKKPSTNAEPTVADEFWFLALEGFSGEELEEIIDGTTAVGNALKLDGHEAEYFFPKSGGMISSSGYLNQLNINRKGDAGGDVGIGFYMHDTQMGTLAYGVAESDFVVRFGTDSSSTTSKRIIHTGNMASHVLPLTGGKLVNGSAVQLEVQNNSGVTTYIGYSNKDGTMGMIGFAGVDEPVFCKADWLARYPLLHGGNYSEYAVSRQGGTINSYFYARGVGENDFRVYSGKNNNAAVQFHGLEDKRLGSLGMRGSKPIFIGGEGDNSVNELLHTGNKPSGSYNGNGSATNRTIQIGGTGNVLCIQSGYYLTFAYSEGAITFAVDTGTTNHFTKEQVNFTDGVLTIATDSGFVNLSGYEYDWNVL